MTDAVEKELITARFSGDFNNRKEKLTFEIFGLLSKANLTVYQAREIIRDVNSLIEFKSKLSD